MVAIYLGEERLGESLFNDGLTGVILPFAGSSAPIGFLLCDGSAVSRKTYAALFDVIGTTYGNGDGSETFNIPDLRETVMVGAGQSSRSAIASHDVYSIGEFKDDQLQSHIHNYITMETSGDKWQVQPTRGNGNNYGGLSTTIDNARHGASTHGKQMGVNFIIKY